MRIQPDEVPGTGDQDDVARFLIELRALGDGDAPPPSIEVAALISGASPRLQRRIYRRMAGRVAVAVAAASAALVVAAANHGLPQPAQRVVSNFVNDLTPFEIAPNPAPATHPPSPTRTERDHSTRHRAAPGGGSESESAPDERPSGSEAATEARSGEDSSAPQASGDGPAGGEGEGSSAGGQQRDP